jgi:23S rRNA G2445 N2-methylase RlmL
LEKNIELFSEKLEKFKEVISKILNKSSIIRVFCERHGNHDFKSVELEHKITQIILSSNEEKNLVASYKEQDVLFYLFINQNKGFFGVDFAGRDLSKRQYRLFNHPTSIKGSLAAAMVWAAFPAQNSVILDPFCSSGVMCVEIAHFLSQKSVNFYKKDFAFTRLPFLKYDWDSFFEKINKEQILSKAKIFGFDQSIMNINAAKKNAKVAGVEKFINFSRVNISDLDLKFKQGSLDIILTVFPSSSKRTALSKIKTLYRDFLRQAEFILKKDGLICILSAKDDISQLKEGTGAFKITEKKRWYSGKQELVFFKLKNIKSAKNIKNMKK